MSNITDIMLSYQDDAQAKHLSRFFKTGKGQYGEGDLFLGIKVPVTRQIVKEHWQTTSIEELETLLASPYHEIRLCALLILVQQFKKAKKCPDQQAQYVDFYLSHTSSINNWDLVDLSCYEILGNWLLDKDRTRLYQLARSTNLWEQRIAIVSCMTFVRHDDFDDAFAIADILLNHNHDLIHKAVGWILREAGKHDVTKLIHFLNTSAPNADHPRYTVMPRTMLRYAIERFEEPLRQAYLKGSI